MSDCRILSAGFSLIEMMVVVAILAIILTIASPNLIDMIDRQRVMGAAEDVRALLSLARSEAIKQSTDVHASIVVSGAYVGLSHDGTCQTEIAKCTIDLAGTEVTKLVKLSDYTGVSIELADDAESSIIFTSRGVPATLGAGTTIKLTSSRGSTLNVLISPIGRVSICVPSTGKKAGAYPSCS